MKPIIETEYKVTCLLDASNFLQRVYDLISVYFQQSIVVSIVDEKNAEVLTNFEVYNNFDFDFVRSVFAKNYYNLNFICTVQVWNRTGKMRGQTDEI
jgi:hypothetical protein